MRLNAKVGNFYSTTPYVHGYAEYMFKFFETAPQANSNSATYIMHYILGSNDYDVMLKTTRTKLCAE